MKIAVVGAGISGLGAAWLLSSRHKVVLFERDARLGGHANTIEAPGNGPVPVDTGFIVYNTRSYPNLVALFDHLGVATVPTHMGFSVSLADGGYEYSGDGIATFFGQPKNLLSPSHWRMAAEIVRFFREAQGLMLPANSSKSSLGAWLAEKRFSKWFIERHIVPMGAAIWSTPEAQVLDFPAAAFARFFANHGLLQISGRPQWRTVQGGSQQYVDRLRHAADFSVAKDEAVEGIERRPGGVVVRTRRGHQERFDRVLIATHADDALALLQDADVEETKLLGSFRYIENEAVLHTDAALMPQRRRLWSSWNYRSGDGSGVALTYWMNKLQPLNCEKDFFVSVNPGPAIAGQHVIYKTRYAHPMFDARAMAAQKELWSLQGRRATWFAGSYFGFGFHEDGLQAGLAAAEEMGEVRRPWMVEGESDRLHLGPAAPARIAKLAAQ